MPRSIAGEGERLGISKRTELAKECLLNKRFTDKSYSINCFRHYHHYNSDVRKAGSYKPFYNKSDVIRKGKVRIAEFNALHPGMSKTRFKDYTKVAQILNEFDLIGVTELIPSMADDLEHNEKLIAFLSEAPAYKRELESEIRRLQYEIQQSTRSTMGKERDLKESKKKLSVLINDVKHAKNLYRVPGYLKILDALNSLKANDEWALILTPRGEGPATSSTFELVGYYYRKTMARPKVNKYCQNSRRWTKSAPYACIVNMDARDMGEDVSEAFSRRPFLAEFESGNFSYTLLTSHILFNSPDSDAAISYIMRKAFDTYTYEHLGTGINKSNYARFAEVKMTLDFIQRNLNQKGHQKDIIYMGDLNLESDNQFWPQVLPSWSDAKIYIKGLTSLSNHRFDSDGRPTHAGASNYDHFIFNPHITSECTQKSPKRSTNLDGGVYNFTKGRWAKNLNRIYKVRYERYQDPYRKYILNERKYRTLVERFITPKLDMSEPSYTVGRKFLKVGGKNIQTTGVIIDYNEDQEFAKFFDERVLKSQLYDDTYYYYFVQLLSDHFPIYMNCSTD